MTPKEIKQAVELVQARFVEIERREYNPKTYSYNMSITQMWQAASQVAIKPEWCEIIRVLAQGGEYYSIEWPC